MLANLIFLNGLFHACCRSPGSEGFIKNSLAGREVTHAVDLVVHLGQEEVNERGDLRFFLHDLRIAVDEQRAGDRVASVIDGGFGRVNAFNGYNKPDIDRKDVWQFKNFLITDGD